MRVDKLKPAAPKKKRANIKKFWKRVKEGKVTISHDVVELRENQDQEFVRKFNKKAIEESKQFEDLLSKINLDQVTRKKQ